MGRGVILSFLVFFFCPGRACVSENPQNRSRIRARSFALTVVFVGVGLSGVLCPTIEGRAGCRTIVSENFGDARTTPILTIRAVKMNRVSTIRVIDESYYRLSPLAHHEGRARCHAIVAHKSSLAQVWVDLLFKRFDINLIVVDWGTIGKGELPWIMSARKVRDLSLQSYSLQWFLDRGDR